jgi:hypothetical protein
MNIKTHLLLLAFPIVFFSCQGPVEKPSPLTKEQIAAQLRLLDESVQKVQAEDPTTPNGQQRLMPRTIQKDGSLSVCDAGDWTSGFYPGVLWYMFEMTGQPEWKEKAIKQTEMLEDQQYNGSDHDVGFRMFCSYGNAYRLTSNPDYIPVLEQSARTLIARYYENVGCIRSWNFNEENWQCPVIIDNMMNLELLFWATIETGDSIYHDIALSHALTTLKNHFRPDNSSVHVVDYDTISGEVRQKNTHQGYSDESSWARGQAWGLYGYTMTYRFTRNKEFLRQAEKIADFLLGHPNLPEDMVPYWDFDAPEIPDEPRDVSAAAIMASALYELSTYSDMGDTYKQQADKILESLGTTYASASGENYGFILGHSVGAKPMDSEVDVPLNYADYYYLEARVRKMDLEAY